MSARNAQTTSNEKPDDGRHRKKRPEGVLDDELVSLVRAWIETAMSGKDEVALPFVKGELDWRLGWYRSQTSRWRRVQIATWLVTAILGLLVSVLAGLKTGHTVLILAGALVATLTTFNQAMHPGRRANGYDTARLQLREAAWDLVNQMGQYAAHKHDSPACYELFVKQVRDIAGRRRIATRWEEFS